MLERNGRGHRTITSKGDYWNCRLASLRESLEVLFIRSNCWGQWLENKAKCVYITASGLPKRSLKDKGKVPFLICCHNVKVFFTSVYLQTPCLPEPFWDGWLLDSGWSYIGHWCSPMRRNEGLEGNKAVIAYKLFSCI